MSGIPEKNNPPQHAHHSMSGKFARIDNNPNVRNAQYYTPIIPTYKNAYRPEFGKSPVTSVQMYRKNKSRSINFNEGPQQIAQPQQQYKKSFLSDIDWKKYLLWGLAALLIIGLLVGLIFLIKALAGNNDKRNYHQPDVSLQTGYYTGVNPIYVNPVPYSTMQVPTMSGYVAEPNIQDRYIYATAPTNPAIQETPVKKEQQTKQSQAVNPITQPTIRFTSDSSQSYVNPIDVYGHHHK